MLLKSLKSCTSTRGISCHTRKCELLWQAITSVSADPHISRVATCHHLDFRTIVLGQCQYNGLVLIQYCEDMWFFLLVSWEQCIFFTPLLHPRFSLIHARHPICHLSSMSECLLWCDGNRCAENCNRHLRPGAKIRVRALYRQWLSPNPSARWLLSAIEMDNPHDSHVQMAHTRKHTHSRIHAFCLLSAMTCFLWHRCSFSLNPIVDNTFYNMAAIEQKVKLRNRGCVNCPRPPYLPLGVLTIYKPPRSARGCSFISLFCFFARWSHPSCLR